MIKSEVFMPNHSVQFRKDLQGMEDRVSEQHCTFGYGDVSAYDG